MRISDWSSDVCSSDLILRITGAVMDDAGQRIAAPQGGCRAAQDFDLFDCLDIEHVAAGERKAADAKALGQRYVIRSEEHTSELQSLMRISYAVFCLKKKKTKHKQYYKYTINMI